MADGEQVNDEVKLDELLPWLEFACWTALVLFPILQYVNGPSVSAEQAVMRTCLVIGATLGAIVLRLVNWKRRNAATVKSDATLKDK